MGEVWMFAGAAYYFLEQLPAFIKKKSKKTKKAKTEKREEDKNGRGVISNMSTVDVSCLIFNSRVGDYAFDEVSFAHKWKCCLHCP